MNMRAARLQQMGAAPVELEILNSRAQDTGSQLKFLLFPWKEPEAGARPSGKESGGPGTAGRAGALQEGWAHSPGRQKGPGPRGHTAGQPGAGCPAP